ncbi:interleukin-22 receptor subunit alpha-2 [Antechinus flavipes]|uniref:interleukin-22 receptor subunit alpha-2 n=1 Tax=Antechinus flavipes TaxID=38775 RepID=UPI002235DF1D|nr:interleukin-22 receptor subunit alpha-2 [Antechinus flavipes]
MEGTICFSYSHSLTMMIKHCFLSFLIKFLWIYGGGSRPVQESLRPLRVEFQSFNLQNILQWHPGSAFTPNNTVYFVQYKIYGEKQWNIKEECWGIHELFCDLTNEMSDVQEPYYGRVKAVSAGIHTNWSKTERFNPWWETKIGPPSINVIQSNKSMQLTLYAPSSPYKSKKGRNISIQNYYELVYRVFVANNSQDKKQKVYEGTNHKVEMDMISGSNNCLVAEIYLPELDRSSESTEICIFMTQRNDTEDGPLRKANST